jgi:hypothetical protein
MVVAIVLVWIHCHKPKEGGRNHVMSISSRSLREALARPDALSSVDYIILCLVIIFCMPQQQVAMAH